MEFEEVVSGTGLVDTRSGVSWLPSNGQSWGHQFTDWLLERNNRMLRRPVILT